MNSGTLVGAYAVSAGITGAAAGSLVGFVALAIPDVGPPAAAGSIIASALVETVPLGAGAGAALGTLWGLRNARSGDRDAGMLKFVGLAGAIVFAVLLLIITGVVKIVFDV
jgi:hypothetical protein